MKTAVVVAAHGSTDSRAGQDLDSFLALVRARFAGMTVRTACASRFVRAALARQGKPAPSLRESLEALGRKGYDRVAIQTLHVVAGTEFEEMAGDLEREPPGLSVSLGRPLLDSGPDLDRTAAALAAEPPLERAPGEAMVFMGHGTSHPAGAAYRELARLLTQRDPHVFLGCLESGPGIGEIRDAIVSLGLKRARLMPFMALAGAHARRDMAGGGPDSWASVLTGAGVECRPVLKGLCALAGVAEIWLDHLGKALAELSYPG